jgi:hypothetical protein|tara:strand:+ start:907 stop:1335 length:429 start_codon:yes stop_codon:yes gene_type:complete
MTFDEIQAMWEQDAKIDPVELDTASLSIPQLHSKYFKIFSEYRFKKKQAAGNLKQLTRRKFEYYSGKGDPEDYRENPFDLKLLKSDLTMYIESDPHIKDLQLKIDMYDIIIEYLESVIRMINTRSYQIKNAIEWKSFIEGIR